MISKYISRLLTLTALSTVLGAGEAHAQTQGNVQLLENLGGGFSVVIQPGYQTFLNYFNGAVGWIFEVAVGFTVLWVLIGGFMYMTSGNNQSRRGEAISRITWAITGLFMLLFAGFILRSLNNVFFV
tara:strand:- start:672 stop:1052 length:381 start_codon:yes stop_codon:yes gene_type:complete